MNFWDGKKVLVTGGAGFIGSHVIEELLRRSPTVRVTVADDFSSGRRANLRSISRQIRMMKLDLLQPQACLKACRGQELVLHLAARVAGIAYNRAHPATMFRENMLLGCHLLEAARQAGVSRVLMASTACVYPRGATVPTPEREGFLGQPEPTNAGYGWAKRMAEFLAEAYASEFGLDITIVRPYNAYGPRDHFGREDSHVIAALMARVLRGDDPVLVWGDGRVTRSFLYVEDLARGIVDAAERGRPEPLNLGADEEVTVAELAAMILRAAGSKARLRFDPSQPSGQPRRSCDATRARRLLGFKARVRLHEGLQRTVAWYRQHLGTKTMKEARVIRARQR